MSDNDPYDNGGVLPDGLSTFLSDSEWIAVNNTGRAEPVYNQDQWLKIIELQAKVDFLEEELRRRDDED